MNELMFALAAVVMGLLVLWVLKQLVMRSKYDAAP
jgi:hypothetical protein